jgi:hypothetical protein
MNAIASPKILYLDKKSLNSFHNPFGGVGGGPFSTASLIFRNSTNISSSFDNKATSDAISNFLVNKIIHQTTAKTTAICTFYKAKI